MHMTINIVMVEPQIPQNTGNVARTCAATGARLHLVGPMGFTIDDKKLKRAGLDYWHLLDISYYEDINEFFFITSNGAIPKPEKSPLTAGFDYYYFSTKAKQTYTKINYPDNAYILFGSETKGLDNDLLEKTPNNCIRFPMREGARSLNLSNAVAIGVYEVLRQWDFPDFR